MAAWVNLGARRSLRRTGLGLIFPVCRVLTGNSAVFSLFAGPGCASYGRVINELRDQFPTRETGINCSGIRERSGCELGEFARGTGCSKTTGRRGVDCRLADRATIRVRNEPDVGVMFLQ